MPHQCVRCSTFYEDGAKEILEGCTCGGKLFFFIKQSKLDKIKKESEDLDLTKEDRKQMEQDVYDLVGSQIDDEKPVVLDFESVRVLQPGKYELDIVQLFKSQPLVFKLEDGKYLVDIKKSFQRKDE